LRKAIKIKAFSMILAWLMIFAHSVIPHVHRDECMTGYHEYVQKISHEISGTGVLMSVKTRPHDEKVCHVTNFILGQMSQDIPLYHSRKEISLIPVIIPGLKRYNKQIIYIPEHFFSSSLLRAPPLLHS
jgi:hypothetical protein